MNAFGVRNLKGLRQLPLRPRQADGLAMFSDGAASPPRCSPGRAGEFGSARAATSCPGEIASMGPGAVPDGQLAKFLGHRRHLPRNTPQAASIRITPPRLLGPKEPPAWPSFSEPSEGG